MIRRREFLAASASIAAFPVVAADQMRKKRLPGTSIDLPVVGLGNSNAFRSADLAASETLLELLHERGGSYVDCSGESRFVVANAAGAAGLTDALFLGAYFDLGNPDQAKSEALRLGNALGREQLSLMQCYTDQVDAHWDVLRGFREAGLTQLIGTARHRADYYDQMIALMQTGTLDVLQVNYSILEPEAEERVLPTAVEHGVAVMINRPFINGEYFQLVRGHSLPDWASEFDCESWAQFSLKFILSHPAVNCVLTETANPRHALDNLSAGFGRLPDPDMRERMRAHLLQLT